MAGPPGVAADACDPAEPGGPGCRETLPRAAAHAALGTADDLCAAAADCDHGSAVGAVLPCAGGVGVDVGRLACRRRELHPMSVPASASQTPYKKPNLSANRNLSSSARRAPDRAWR